MPTVFGDLSLSHATVDGLDVWDLRFPTVWSEVDEPNNKLRPITKLISKEETSYMAQMLNTSHNWANSPLRKNLIP